MQTDRPIVRSERPRPRSRASRSYTGSQLTVTIKGRKLNLHLARMKYRCEECLGELGLKNRIGLMCKDNPDHRGFIHEKEAEKVKKKQQEAINQLKEVYAIEGGKVVIK